MLIATFGPSTAWVGKTISYDDGQFMLEDVGQVTAQAVAEYDRQGHLAWAYDGLREWAYQVAGLPAPVPAPAPEATTAAAAATAAPVAPVTPTIQVADVAPHVTSPVTPPTMPPVMPPAPPDASQTYAPTEPVQPAAAGDPGAGPAPSATPEPADTPAPAATTAPAATPPAAGGKSRGAWLVIASVVILALLIGVVAAGGRLRDGVGIAFMLLAVVAVVALIVAAVKPGAVSRWFPGAAPRTLLVTCGVITAACFILAGVLWWMPHYEVIAPTDKRVALDDQPEIKVMVVNRGLFGGTYTAAYSVDGEQQDAIAFPLGGGDVRELTLSLPAGVERGPVLLSLGGASVEARAVAPPAFVVAPLQVEPSPAKLGDDVVLTTSVQNTGDIGGTFGGALLVDGQELMAQPVEIAPGQTKDVTYDITADVDGEYQLQLGDAAVEFVIVEPVRLANGYVVKRSATGGRAYMTIKNKTGADAIALLTRTSNKRKPVLAVYLRDGKTAKIKGIPDGTYILWDCCGDDFNWTMRDFYTSVEHKRWLQPLKFNTTADTDYWTSYWSDSYYNYSQKRSQTTTHWTNWTVTIGTGESKYTKTVTESGFPQL
jgi:hypothetical protein